MFTKNVFFIKGKASAAYSDERKVQTRVLPLPHHGAW
jgi:hypothetical protein